MDKLYKQAAVIGASMSRQDRRDQTDQLIRELMEKDSIRQEEKAEEIAQLQEGLRQRELQLSMFQSDIDTRREQLVEWLSFMLMLTVLL